MKTTDAQHITAAECARRLGLTAQAVGLWASKHGAPCTKEKTRVMVRWPDFARWREDQLIANATSALRERLAKLSSGSDGAGDPITRRAIAEARRAEIEVEQLEGRVVPVELARADFARRLTHMRNILIPFPRTAAPKILGAKTLAELEMRLEGEIRRLMELLATPPAIGADDHPNDTERAA